MRVKEHKGGGTLNPTWVEWLMGYPSGWTDLNASETVSSPTSPTTSDAASSNPIGANMWGFNGFIRPSNVANDGEKSLDAQETRDDGEDGEKSPDQYFGGCRSAPGDMADTNGGNGRGRRTVRPGGEDGKRRIHPKEEEQA